MKQADLLLIRAAKRDPARFDVLYIKYYQLIFNYFWYRVSYDIDVAEDLTQDVFVKAFQHLERFRFTKASYSSYLLTIAHNLLVNYYRTTKPLSLDSAANISYEIMSAIEERELAEQVWSAVRQLSLKDQDVIYFKYQRGLKICEIAVITKRTENAVKLALSRARKKLGRSPELRILNQFSDLPRAPTAQPRYRDLM